MIKERIAEVLKRELARGEVLSFEVLAVAILIELKADHWLAPLELSDVVVDELLRRGRTSEKDWQRGRDKMQALWRMVREISTGSHIAERESA